jgi:tetratricopeptide (TPR) repeat protein/DNA-binding CsgD family transcriptional regulator
MQHKQTILSQDFYVQHLSTINNVHFTGREIDVIACLLSGRKTSKIAFFLSIDPRTVETHIRNIMIKLECNTRERIIDFIETSGKILPLRKYYSLLRIEALFKKSLKDISKLPREKVLHHVSIIDEGKNSLFFHLKSHLSLAGFSVSSAIRKKEEDFLLCIFPETSCRKEVSLLLQKAEQNSKKIIILLQGRKNYKELFPGLKKMEVINFEKEGNYYFSFFLILKKFLKHPDLDKIITEFKNKYKVISLEFQSEKISLNEKRSENRVKVKSKFVLNFLLVIGIFGIGLLTLFWNQENDHLAFRSDLVIPKNIVCLDRPELMQKIDAHLKKQNGIQTVALVGPGGAGKTTLARQYAQQQRGNIVWEINAETLISLNESFKNFAEVLAKTDEDKKLLRGLNEIKLSIEREKKLIEFVRDRLKLHSSWFLIYDNVENFEVIKSYFPINDCTWGAGRIILTTRNENIQNNKQMNGIILTGELTATQKLDLFMKIMQQGKERKLPMQENKELTEFLKQLPPFPLDISTAAYYLKTVNISYSQYLENLKHQDENFRAIQENLLKDGGDYQNTRYAIITCSLEQLIKNHKDFPDLLLLVSLLDSQNIPKELLDKYKNPNIVDNFIYHLKNHSLISTSLSESSYSMHRSTQAIAYSYLKKLLALNGETLTLKKIIYALDNYADKHIELEDFPKMQIITRHLEKVLSHSDILNDFSKGLLGSKLGSAYYFIKGDQSKKILDNSLNMLRPKLIEKLSPSDAIRLAHSLLHIGAIYTELRLYKEAKEIFKKASHIYEQDDIKNYADLSWALSYLGNVDRRLGNYEMARDYLEKSIQIHKQYGVDKKRLARTLVYLGSVYRGLGFYQKSVDTLEESLSIYDDNYPNDHFRIGWTLIRLGNVYSNLGDFKKAKYYFEKGLLISKNYLPHDHVSMGLTLTYLGICYRELGEYNKSAGILEQSLKINQKHFNPYYRRMGWVLFHLATTYKVLGKTQEAQEIYNKVLKIYANYCHENSIEVANILRNMAKINLDLNHFNEAEDLTQKSLKILEPRQHIDAYRSYEVLGEIYLKKCSQTMDVKNDNEIESLKIKAISFFNQALQKINTHFSQDSTHIQRLKARIKSVQK